MEVAKTLAQQALPFRGDSNEDGNFYQVVLLLSRHVPNLKRWLSDKRLNPYHITYLSPQSQNEFITLLEKELRGKVIEEVKRAGMFSVMADTTKMMDDQIEASVIFASNIEIDAEADFNRHHRPRKAPRRVDEQAGTATVFLLQAYYRNQFRKVLDVLTSRMKEHLVQCQKSLLPLLKCLTPPIDGSEINSAASLISSSQSPDTLAVEAELQVLAELLPSDIGKDYTNVVEVSEANKLSLPLANSIIRLMLTAPVTVASNECLFSQLKFVKNKLCTSMKDARLTGLMLLTCERDLTDTLNLEEVARKWSLLKRRRVAIF